MNAPLALPGDIVEVTIPGRRGALVVVEEVYAGRVSGYMPFARTKDNPTEKVPVRLRLGEFVRVGTAARVSPELARAREAAIATLTPEPAPAPPRDPSGDGPPRFAVVIRFEDKAGKPTTVDTIVVAGSAGEALEEVLDQVEKGSFVTGLTVEEVRS